MRLTFTALGLSLDLTFGPAEVEADDEPVDYGYTTSYPVGFVARHELPDDAAIHRPVSPFEDDSEI